MHLLDFTHLLLDLFFLTFVFEGCFYLPDFLIRYFCGYVWQAAFAEIDDVVYFCSRRTCLEYRTIIQTVLSQCEAICLIFKKIEDWPTDKATCIDYSLCLKIQPVKERYAALLGFLVNQVVMYLVVLEGIK